MTERARDRRWMPLSVSFTLVNLLPLSNCPVLSMCEYVSPVSHLIDTCPARSNGRTLVGARDIQTLSAYSLLYVRLSPYSPPFYRHRPTSGPGQPICSPRTRRPWNQEAVFEISNNINITISSSIDDRRENSSRTQIRVGSSLNCGPTTLPELLPYFETDTKSNKRST